MCACMLISGSSLMILPSEWMAVVLIFVSHVRKALWALAFMSLSHGCRMRGGSGALAEPLASRSGGCKWGPELPSAGPLSLCCAPKWSCWFSTKNAACLCQTLGFRWQRDGGFEAVDQAALGAGSLQRCYQVLCALLKGCLW